MTDTLLITVNSQKRQRCKEKRINEKNYFQMPLVLLITEKTQLNQFKTKYIAQFYYLII